MKKNIMVMGAVFIIAATQLGFDWGGTPTTKKSTSAPAQPATSSMNVAEMSMPQVMGALSHNLTLWTSLSPTQKTECVTAVIALYRSRENTAILNSPSFYVTQLDQGLKSNPTLQANDVISMIKVLSVMEYDFYNGQNKDELAKSVLGEQMFQTIKLRRSGR